VWRTPTLHGIVQVSEVAGKSGCYQWQGEQHLSTGDLPAEVKAAMGVVLALLPAHLRCYVVLDDREGADGAIRLLTVNGGQITVRNDGAQVDIKAPASGGLVRVEGAGKVVLEAPIIELGAGATEAIVKGTEFKALYDWHVHPTGVGPSGPPAVGMDVVPGTHLSLIGKVK